MQNVLRPHAFLMNVNGGRVFRPIPWGLMPERPFPAGADRDDRRAIQRLNQRFSRRFPNASDLETRILNYELAARMLLTA